jgi:hypothetical protein
MRTDIDAVRVMARRIPILGANSAGHSKITGDRDCTDHSGWAGDWNHTGASDCSSDASHGGAEDDYIPSAAHPGWKAQFERNLAGDQ